MRWQSQEEGKDRTRDSEWVQGVCYMSWLLGVGPAIHLHGFQPVLHDPAQLSPVLRTHPVSNPPCP